MGEKSYISLLGVVEVSELSQDKSRGIQGSSVLLGGTFPGSSTVNDIQTPEVPLCCAGGAYDYHSS